MTEQVERHLGYMHGTHPEAPRVPLQPLSRGEMIEIRETAGDSYTVSLLLHAAKHYRTSLLNQPAASEKIVELAYGSAEPEQLRPVVESWVGDYRATYVNSDGTPNTRKIINELNDGEPDDMEHPMIDLLREARTKFGQDGGIEAERVLLHQLRLRSQDQHGV